MAPRWLKTRPRSAKNRPRGNQDRPRSPKRRPRGVQEASKRRPRGIQERPNPAKMESRQFWRASEALLGRILMLLRRICSKYIVLKCISSIFFRFFKVFQVWWVCENLEKHQFFLGFFDVFQGLQVSTINYIFLEKRQTNTEHASKKTDIFDDKSKKIESRVPCNTKKTMNRR